MASTVTGFIVMAYIVVTYIAMAKKVIAYIAMAYIFVACRQRCPRDGRVHAIRTDSDCAVPVRTITI